jgi:hypothetical protein
MIYPNFCGSSYTSQSRIADAELTMNWYEEVMESEGAPARRVLYPTPGLASFAMASIGSRIRQLFAIIAQNVERCFAVSGPELYEVFQNQTLTPLGAMVEDVNVATMVTNGDGGGELFITSGNEGYLFDLTSSAFSNPVSQVTMGGMVDGYFVALDAPTSTLKISNLLDGTTWDPTQFAQRSSQPDPWRALCVNYNEIWLLGSQTTEVWYDAGTFPFPFAPRPGAIIQQGIAAIFSVQVLNGAVIWLTHNQNGQAQVVSAPGYVAQRISNHAMEFQISRYSRIDDASAWVYEDQGHSFYVLNFPTASATWVYDAITQKWHQRGTWIATNNNFDEWHPNCHTLAFGTHLVGDRRRPVIYTMDIELTSDVDERPIRRVRRGPSLQNELQYLFVGKFELEMEVGNGTLATTAPQILLRTSADGGQTFGKYRLAGSGPIGASSTRVYWERNGVARNFVPEITVSDPVAWRIVNAFVDVEPQANGAA